MFGRGLLDMDMQHFFMFLFCIRRKESGPGSTSQVRALLQIYSALPNNTDQ